MCMKPPSSTTPSSSSVCGMHFIVVGGEDSAAQNTVMIPCNSKGVIYNDCELLIALVS